MKTIRKLKLEKVVPLLNSAIRGAEMKTADFDPFNPKSGLTKTIKERTELYRGSWIISPIQQALDIISKELNRN